MYNYVNSSTIRINVDIINMIITRAWTIVNFYSTRHLPADECSVMLVSFAVLKLHYMLFSVFSFFAKAVYNCVMRIIRCVGHSYCLMLVHDLCVYGQR